MTMPLRIWWHELNTWEPEQARRFYQVTLGWYFRPTEMPGGGSYWVAHQDGRPVGGIFELTEPEYQGIPSHWMTYLAVPDLLAAEIKAEAAGGEILRPAFHLSGVGKLAVVSDPAGAIIGLIEPEDVAAGRPIH